MEARLFWQRVGQGNGERASLAYLAGHRQGSPVRLDNRLDDGQPRLSAAPVLAARFAGAIEAAEDVGLLLRRGARRRVPNEHQRFALNLLYAHGDVAILGRAVLTVINHIVDGLLNQPDSLHQQKTQVKWFARLMFYAPL